jgi:hypothetical protein
MNQKNNISEKSEIPIDSKNLNETIKFETESGNTKKDKINSDISTSENSESLEDINEKAEYIIDSYEYKNIIRTLKILYFLSGFTSSSWGRLSTIFYTIKGLTPSQIGYLEGLILIFRLILTPIWGYVSDKSRSKKKIFIICSAASTIILCAFASDTITNMGTWMIYIIAISTAIFTNQGIINPYAIEVLGKNSSIWGDLRVWKAISWGIGSFIFSAVYDYFKDFKINFG